MTRKLPQIGSRTLRAFTLTEILVVMAIITTLLVLLFPAVGLVINKAGTSESASNLRQLGVAMHAFAGENSGAFPPTASQTSKPEGGWENLGSWDGYLLPYLGVDAPPIAHDGYYGRVNQVARLLSHPDDESEVITPLRVRRGYAMISGDGFVGKATWSGTGWYPSARIGAIPSPANTILITEFAGLENNVIGRTGNAGIRTVTRQKEYQAELNEGGKFNYLFCDGHVELLHPDETIGSGSEDKPRGMWTLDPAD